MLDAGDTVVVLIDIQGRLADAMFERERLVAGARNLLAGAAELKVPVLWTEQAPAKLGPTIPELVALMPGARPIPKVAFSCMGEPEFVRQLRELGRSSVLLAGIETHVCVYQTARDLLAAGYHVELVADAVSSRTAANLRTGTGRILAEGARLTSVEMCLFELQRVAEGNTFRAISRIIR